MQFDRSARREAHAAAEAERRHRHGARAAGRGDARRRLELPHGPLPAAPRRRSAIAPASPTGTAAARTTSRCGSSPITRAPPPSWWPTACSRATRAAATCCGASCGAPSGTASDSASTSSSSRRSATAVVRNMDLHLPRAVGGARPHPQGGRDRGEELPPHARHRPAHPRRGDRARAGAPGSAPWTAPPSSSSTTPTASRRTSPRSSPREAGLGIDEAGFEREMAAQQERSRGSEVGGEADRARSTRSSRPASAPSSSSATRTRTSPLEERPGEWRLQQSRTGRAISRRAPR